VVLFILNFSDIPLTTFAIIGTTLAVGIGFGTQNIIQNFASGLILLIERPIQLEDIIEINNLKGKVIKIGTRCTHVLTEENMLILIPNGELLQKIIINHTHDNNIAKAILNIKISNTLTIEELDNKILESIKKQKNILRNPSPQILYKNINKLYYDINVVFYFSSNQFYRNENAINDLNRALKNALEDYYIAYATPF